MPARQDHLAGRLFHSELDEGRRLRVAGDKDEWRLGTIASFHRKRGIRIKFDNHDKSKKTSKLNVWRKLSSNEIYEVMIPVVFDRMDEDDADTEPLGKESGVL